MKHIMLDLETLGKRAGCAVRSIGALPFDWEGNFGEPFYMNVDRDSCDSFGLFVDPETEAWWAKQSAKAQEALTVDPRPLADVALDFNRWFRENAVEFVWAHGTAFDITIWEAASLAAGVPIPWDFKNTRDTRTLHHMCDFKAHSVKRDGTYHTAIDDCRHQVKVLLAALAHHNKRKQNGQETQEGPQPSEGG